MRKEAFVWIFFNSDWLDNFGQFLFEHYDDNDDDNVTKIT